MGRIISGSGLQLAWLLALLLGLMATAQAEIFQCRGANGEVSFLNRPCADSPVAEPETLTTTGKHFLWLASKGAGRLYLLGSIHYGLASMYPLPAVMQKAFEQSESLVVEMNILDVTPVQMAELVAEKAIYRDGSTLKQHLPPETWQRLEVAANKFGLPVESLNTQKPWFVSMTLMSLVLNRLGYDENLGIDRHFLERARGKRVIELEGLAWQLALFDQLSEREQAAMLEETLAEMDQGKAFFERMLRAWKIGDGDEIRALFEEGADDADGQRLNQLMIHDRNLTMTASLEKLAHAGGTHFVVVGAGHLPGGDGILELLRQRGFQISQY